MALGNIYNGVAKYGEAKRGSENPGYRKYSFQVGRVDVRVGEN